MTREGRARPAPGIPQSSAHGDRPSLPILKFNSKLSPLGKRGVKRQQEGAGTGGGRKRPAGRWAGSSRPWWGMPAIPQSVPTQPASSTHQEREIESIPIRPCECGPETGGLEAGPLGEGWGRRVAMWWCSSSEDRKAAVSCFRCWGPWELLSWQEEPTGSAGLCGWGRSHVSYGTHRSQPGRQAGLGLTQRSADLLRRRCPPPLPLTHLPGRWWAAIVVGNSRDFSPFGFRSRASDFKAASLVVKSRWELVPQFSELGSPV